MSKYIPPHCRNSKEQEKYVLKENNFPALVDIKKSEDSTLNFACMLKGETEVTNKSNVKAGYVRLYFKGNKIMKEFGPEDSTYIEYKEDEIIRKQKIIINMIKRWQKYRDEQNDLYSDRSEFWNKASLLDITDDNESDLDDYEDYLDNSESESDNDLEIEN